MPVLNKLKSGPATLLRMDLHGPSAELQKSAPLLTSVATKVNYFNTDVRMPSLIDLARPEAPRLT